MKETRIAMRVFPTGIWLLATLILSFGLDAVHSPLVPLPGVLTLLLIPGASLLSLLRVRPANIAGRFVLAVCFSMTVIMVVGGLASIIGPHIGVRDPLDPLPEYTIWIVLAIVSLVICARKHRDPVTWTFEGIRPSSFAGALPGSLLVLLSILGVAQLNGSGDNHLAVFSAILDVAVLLVGILGAWRWKKKWPLNTLLYCISVALLTSTSLRGGHLYGWDVQQEFGVASDTLRAGVWIVPANHDPYASMLSLTVLPTVLHSLVRLRLLAFFRLVIPGVLAMLPLAVFSTVNAVPRWITSGRRVPRTSLAYAVVVGLIVSSSAFPSELVSITRQAMALTMLAALVMVLLDRTVTVRPAQICVGILTVAVSFTHYTTSYLLAGIFLCAWLVGILWSRGWLGTRREKREGHRNEVRSRKIINIVLVVVALSAAFGWNLGVTRNTALSAPSNAVASQGVGLSSSVGPSYLAPSKLQDLLVSELEVSEGWIVPIPGSGSVPLIKKKAPASPGIVHSLSGVWNELSFLCEESLWVVLGISLLYGLLRLGRRRSYEYSSDLVGIAVAGLLIGGLLRFSGTLAQYYSPERAAIFTAILLAAPVTLLLDDLLVFLQGLTRSLLARASLSGGVVYLVVLIVGATGLSELFFGGQPPGSLTARDVNAEQFTVSTPELATAVWLRKNVKYPNVVQSDEYGQLVLLSEPGNYDSLDEIIPPEVNDASYIYLSSANLEGDISQATADNGAYFTVYRTTSNFFNQNFFVVYSTGSTRIYH